MSEESEEESVQLQKWECIACAAVRVRESGLRPPQCIRCEKVMRMAVPKEQGKRRNSLQMANAARANRGKTPWRGRPHVAYSQNLLRSGDWLEKKRASAALHEKRKKEES